MAERTVVLWFGGGSGDDESSSDEEYVPMQDTGDEEEVDDNEDDDDDDDDNEEEQNDDDEEEYDDDDDNGRGFWEPEDEDDELSSETEEFLRGVIEKALPEDVRTSIDRIFAGESYFPMLFARSEHELKQKKKIANERIAHQLRGYNSDFTERKNSDGGSCGSNGTNMSLPSSSARHFPLHYHRTNKKRMFHTLCLREQVGLTSTAQSIKLQETFMPFQENKHCKVVDYVRDRLYCGGFNSTGSSFLAAGQRSEILLYDTANWERGSSLPVHDVRWTVTDAKFTPDDQNVLYSSINSNVRMVSVNYKDDGKEEVFCLIKPPRGTRHSEMHHFTMGRFGVWCMDVNASGTEFVAGTASNSVVLYDMQTKTPMCHVEGHHDDVNAIAFVDGPLHSNVFVSGSDDQLIKLWDRRVLSESNPRAQGVFPGHTDGLTHISSRDDGYYFVSNSKDQSCKLWDIRKCMSSEAYDRAPRFRRPYRWDYRYQSYPGRNKLPVTHPNDMSVMTYRGHMIMETLIRCYFSPLHSTAQKYIYTGSADGRVYVYDSISGDLVEVFAMKPNGLTRDVRWHPFEPTIVSPDFYGKLCVWERHE